MIATSTQKVRMITEKSQIFSGFLSSQLTVIKFWVQMCEWRGVGFFSCLGILSYVHISIEASLFLLLKGASVLAAISYRPDIKRNIRVLIHCSIVPWDMVWCSG